MLCPTHKNSDRLSRGHPECKTRFGNKEFARFARIAKASRVEVLNHLIDANDQRLLTKDEFLLHEHLPASR
jgi:hypothetical protein